MLHGATSLMIKTSSKQKYSNWYSFDWQRGWHGLLKTSYMYTKMFIWGEKWVLIILLCFPGPVHIIYNNFEEQYTNKKNVCVRLHQTGNSDTCLMVIAVFIKQEKPRIYRATLKDPTAKGKQDHLAPGECQNTAKQRATIIWEALKQWLSAKQRTVYMC